VRGGGGRGGSWTKAEKKSFCVQANCIDSTAEPEAVFAGEVKKMQAEKMKPQEQVGLVITYIVSGVIIRIILSFRHRFKSVFRILNLLVVLVRVFI
jgi:hypothetical protein